MLKNLQALLERVDVASKKATQDGSQTLHHVIVLNNRIDNIQLQLNCMEEMNDKHRSFVLFTVLIGALLYMLLLAFAITTQVSLNKLQNGAVQTESQRP
jgi:small neutral amino acid transporter SnatA (MarC family)